MADQGKSDRDLSGGVPLDAFTSSGMVAGKLGDSEVLLVRTPAGFEAVGAKCTHKGAPLVDGLLVGDTIRCPWHHACFDAGTGAALAAPAFRALRRWRVEQRDGCIYVSEAMPSSRPSPQGTNERIVIVGAGAGGSAAADRLATLGYGPAVTLFGNEADAPYDRTMLSKHFLAGSAGDDELAIEMDDLRTRGVDLRLASTVAAIEPLHRRVRLTDGTALTYDKLILATGAEPKRLAVPGAELSHVRVLRSADDARGIIDALLTATHVVIAGSSFIGMEAAAALRDRDIAVTVVSPDEHPFAQTLGAALSSAIMSVHRTRGTAFRLGRQIARIEPDHVALDDGSSLPADLVIVGVGVSPRTTLAEHAGLDIDDGVLVDTYLRTSDPNIYAVGDIARWPDPHSGQRIRVEHWAVAQRQGQIAASNAVGDAVPFEAVPFFWTMHFDYSVRYSGHGSARDAAMVEGDPEAKDASVRFRRDGQDTAMATVERDRVLLQAEQAMERSIVDAGASA